MHADAKRNKQRGCIKGISMLLAAIFLLSISTTSMAADNTGSIQIEYYGKNEQDQEVLLDHAEFALYYVGKMQDGRWTTDGDFQNSGVDLKGESSSERNIQACQLYEYAVKNNIDHTIQTTNEGGIAQFSNLKQGIYLLSQTHDWEKNGTDVFKSDPFLISIPEQINDTLIWNITSHPKSEWVSKEEQQEENSSKSDTVKKPDQARTGDTAPLVLLMLVLIVSIGLIYFIIKKKNKKDK